jgi:hypothetical protein
MKKEKIYKNTKFNADVIKRSSELFITKLSPESKMTYSTNSVKSGNVNLQFDNDDEFFAEYRKPEVTMATYEKNFLGGDFSVLMTELGNTYITVKLDDRSSIEAVFSIFDDNEVGSRLPEPPKQKPVIFIGHGNNTQWRDLKDQLHEKHGYQVEAYEIGARAGHTIRDILESMLNKSSFAILVMTGEDEDAQGKVHPRYNVIHELGLFQGRLGFNRAIVLLEKNTEAFSNIQGIHQIRFSKNNIKETFGDVLATLLREFGN